MLPQKLIDIESQIPKTFGVDYIVNLTDGCLKSLMKTKAIVIDLFIPLDDQYI